MVRLRSALVLALGAALAAASARASLTQSEQAQIRAFVASGQVQNASRVRAMIARTDLSAEESAAALRDALAPIPFDDGHAAFLRDLLFGGVSASRPITTVAVARALVARADMLLAKHDLDRNAKAFDELARIYRFLQAEIAQRGKNESVPSSAFDACTKALAEHVEKNAHWLKGDAKIPLAFVLVRGQLQLALVDMTNDSPMRRVDLADRLGLAGARRRTFVDRGTLLVDGGHADDAHVDRVRALLDRLPALKDGVTAIAFGEEKASLSAKGTVLAVKTPIEGMGTPDASPFGDEVEPTTIDSATLDLARDLANFAVRRALDSRADLRVIAGRDLSAAAATKTFGKPTVPTIDAGLAAALELLLTDAPRALELAFVRFLAGRPESATVVTDALGALTAFAQASTQGLTITLGKPRANGADTDPLQLTNVRLSPSGAVTAFVMDGKGWNIARATGEGQVIEIKRDGAPLSMAMLNVARVPTTEAASWSIPGLVFARIHGSPRAGVAPGPRIRLIGAGEQGYDAVATPAPTDDVVVEADLTVEHDVAGVAVRAIGTKDGFRGAALVVTPAPKPRVALVLREEGGAESYLAAPVDASTAGLRHVRLAVKGTKIEANYADLVLTGTLPAAFAKGDVAFFARKGAVLEATGFSVKRRAPRM